MSARETNGQIERRLTGARYKIDKAITAFREGGPDEGLELLTDCIDQLRQAVRVIRERGEA